MSDKPGGVTSRENELAKNTNSYRTRIEQLRKGLAAEELAKSRLERIPNTAYSVYDVVSQKATETKIAIATETGVVKIVSLAHEPGIALGAGKKDCPERGSFRPICGIFFGLLGKNGEEREKTF